MIKTMLRHEDNKILFDIESSTFQVDSLTSSNAMKLDKIIGLDAYVILESIAGSQITFRCLLNAGDVDVDCLVSREVK